MGDFILNKELGQGAFGIVYEATKKTTRETVAIKLLQNLSRNRKYSERELEIINLALDHENIVSILGHFSQLGKIYIVMEFCEGGDLNDYIIKNKPELKERFNLMTDMARGLLYLHSQNIVHRDLKPENVLLTNTGQRYICKITDFGLSRIIEHKKEMFSTIAGSIPYFAPEVIEGYSHSKPVDVFSLGLIYFAVFKQSIVQNSFGVSCVIPAKISSKKNYDYLNYILRKEKPSESKFIEDFFSASREMGKLVYSMVSKIPEDRPLIDKVLIEIVEEKVRHDLTGGLEDSMERELSGTKTWQLEQENRIRDLEATISDQKATIRDQQDTIEDILQQNIKLQEKLRKHRDIRKTTVRPKKSTDNRDLKKPSVSKQAEGGAKPKVSA